MLFICGMLVCGFFLALDITLFKQDYVCVMFLMKKWPNKAQRTQTQLQKSIVKESHKADTMRKKHQA